MELIQKIKFYLLKKDRNEGYSDYLKLQLQRSQSKKKEVSPIEKKRKEYLVDLLVNNVVISKIKKSLVVGCRDSYEIDLLQSKGINNVVGIDLQSNDKRIKIMDMHELKFKENVFDLVYCSHSLEHAYDYRIVIQEIARVLKNDGILLIEVPINYETRGSDLHDFQTYDNLITIVSDFVQIQEILLANDIKKGQNNNFCSTDIARLILKISKEQ